MKKNRGLRHLIDIYETNDDYFIVANMPGVSKEDVKIKVEDGDLVIMGRINFSDVLNKKYLLKEIDPSNYYRKFKLSDSINEEKIVATLENGRLTINLPKLERVKPRTIEIN